MIQVDFEIHLNKLNGILDLQSNIMSIPKAGISTDIRSIIDGTANLQSRDYGRLYIDNRELENTNCMSQIISFNNGIIHTSKQNIIPSTALIQFNGPVKRVTTFTLLQKKNVCNHQCHSTSYEELYICTKNLNDTSIKKTSDPNLLKSIKT